MKSAFISIIGRPSSGKSSFINRVCGYKVSIVTPIPQTTRNRIRGIYNGTNVQLIFIDTPGYHLSEKKFNLQMTRLIQDSLEDVDILLYMIDISREPGPEEKNIADFVSKYNGPRVVVMNKIDIKDNYLEEHKAFVQTRLKDAQIFPVSAVTGEGIPELLNHLEEIAPEGIRYYDEDIYTDQEPSFRIAEIIREKVILETREEIPHSIYIEILDMEMQNEGKSLWVRGIIYTERDSQVGIIVGQGGNRIKKIRKEAEKELSTLFPYRVKLDLRVKVKKKWRRDDALLKKLIF